MNENLLIDIAFGLAMTALIGLFFYALCVVSDRVIDEILPPSTEELMRREAEKLQRKADKELKRRQRLKVIRFWNI